MSLRSRFLNEDEIKETIFSSDTHKIIQACANMRFSKFDTSAFASFDFFKLISFMHFPNTAIAVIALLENTKVFDIYFGFYRYFPYETRTWLLVFLIFRPINELFIDDSKIYNPLEYLQVSDNRYLYMSCARIVAEAELLMPKSIYVEARMPPQKRERVVEQSSLADIKPIGPTDRPMSALLLRRLAR